VPEARRRAILQTFDPPCAHAPQSQAAELANAPAFDQPVVSVRDPSSLIGGGGGMEGKAGALRHGGMPSSSGSAGSPAPDGVVPEVPALKKQRV